LTTQCRVDANCSFAQVCSASAGGCGGISGYYCHTSADECFTDNDCCGSSPSCEYDTTKGHWWCQAAPLPCP
jgi:hypothetical protein